MKMKRGQLLRWNGWFSVAVIAILLASAVSSGLVEFALGVLVSVGLGILIALHEIGHYVAARSVGLVPAKVVVGLGELVVLEIPRRRAPPLEVSIGVAPLVGFVRIPEVEFAKAPLRARAAVIAAGPAASWFTAAALFVAAHLLHGAPVAQTALRGLVWPAEGWRVVGRGLYDTFLGATSRHTMNAADFFGSGTAAVLERYAVIAAAIFAFNVLPIPLFDGGKLALFAYEWFAGRKPAERPVRYVTVAASLAFVVLFLVSWCRYIAALF
jgi:membrane-associated protease RseP (regulator of RpoE activity)